MRSILLSALALLLTAHAPTALAATLHKCVGADGKAMYLDRPCEGAPGKTIRVAPLPPQVAKADDEQGYDEGDEGDEADEHAYYEDEPEPVEESDEQVYARKALERRTEALKRKQAQAALAKAGPAVRSCKTGNNCKDKH